MPGGVGGVRSAMIGPYPDFFDGLLVHGNRQKAWLAADLDREPRVTAVRLARPTPDLTVTC